MKPYFLNPDTGYDICKNIEASKAAGETIYNFWLNHPPLMFRDATGHLWKTSEAFTTNQGSVPFGLRRFVDKDRLLGFYFHDDGYRNHSLLRSTNEGESWMRMVLTRKQVDDMLYDMALVDPDTFSPRLARCVWLGVRLGGGWSW